jgi:hypothetical protein
VDGTCPGGSFSGNTYTTGAITANCSVSFSFSQIQHTVAASAGPGGGVTPSSRTIGHGSTASFTVTPNSGYSHGAVDGTCPSGSFNGNIYTTGAITANCSISFSFSQIQHTVTASAGPGGGVTPSSRTVGHGSTTSFTVTPDNGYSHGAVGGTCPSGSFSGNTYTTGPVTSNCTVSATFTIDSYELIVNVSGKGMVTSDPGGISCHDDCSETFTIGTVVTLTAVPHAEANFIGWSGNCAGTDLTCDIAVDQERNVSAKFASSFPWTMFLPVITNDKQP